MTDQGQNAATVPGTSSDTFVVTEEHIQKLISYICNLSSVVIDADPQKVKDLLSDSKNLDVLKAFISEAQNK